MILRSVWGLNLSKYTVIIPEQVNRDTDEAIFYMQSLGMYPKNISEFTKQLATFIKKLETWPETGYNLSSRIDIDSSIKYFVIKDYILFYEIIDTQVTVIRLLPATSNWMSIIMRETR